MSVLNANALQEKLVEYISVAVIEIVGGRHRCLNNMEEKPLRGLATSKQDSHPNTKSASSAKPALLNLLVEAGES